MLKISPKKFVKLTLLIAVNEIDTFLHDTTDSLAKQFATMMELQPQASHAELRQRSLNHVVSHMPQRYEVIDCDKESPEKPKIPYDVLEQTLHIEAVVQDGIFQILPDSSENAI
jgi:hypothetical protein